MIFLEALKSFMRGNNPERIIFDVVNQLLNEFILFKKYKKKNIPDIRFEELKTITYNELIKEGFKSVKENAKDDVDARKRIWYLISQYYNKQYLDANPHIKLLNQDVKFILHGFSNFFPQVGRANRTEHKTITIEESFSNIGEFENYPFAKNEPKKTRLKNVFFAMFKILNEKRSLSYSDLMDELKSNLNITEYSEVSFNPDIDPDNSEEEETSNNNEPKISTGQSEESDEYENDFNDVSILENADLDDSELFIINDVNEYFLNLCTERQKIIFGCYLLLEDARLKKDKQILHEYRLKFEGLKKIFGIARQTIYNDINEAKSRLEFVFSKFDLDDQQKSYMMRKLTELFDDYFRGKS